MELSKNRDKRDRRRKQKQRYRRREDLRSSKYRQRVRADKTILLEEKKRLEEELKEYYNDANSD